MNSSYTCIVGYKIFIMINMDINEEINKFNA